MTADRIILRCYLLRPAQTSSQRKSGEISEPIELEAAVVCRKIQSFVKISKLQADKWFRKSSRGSVIMFHGNGMNYGDCVSGARHIVKMGYTVLILSYRG